MTASIIGFVAVLVLCLLRMPIAFAMGIVGFVGFGLEIGWPPAMALIAQITYDTGLDYGLSVVPLFVMMGMFVARAGLSDDLFNASNAFLGHKRGGLAMATIVACGGFGAICGSSVATVATMAKVAMPSMRRFGYDDRLATGSIAAGGTLGILIPPSIVLIIFGLLTETSIGQLFAAGFLPGIVAIICYTLAVQFVTGRDEKLGPAAERTNWRGRLTALRGVWGVLLLFTVVIGGIYAGVFTPTEAAGIGAAGGFLFAYFRGRLTWASTCICRGCPSFWAAVIKNCCVPLQGAAPPAAVRFRTGPCRQRACSGESVTSTFHDLVSAATERRWSRIASPTRRLDDRRAEASSGFS